jgi:hypothetical protein
MENDNKNDDELLRREEELVLDLERQSVYATHKQLSWQLQLQDEIEEEREDQERDLERQSVYATHKQLSWQLQLQDEIEEERELVRREQEQEDQERDLERQEELDQEYGDSYRCLWFCGDKEERVLER